MTHPPDLIERVAKAIHEATSGPWEFASGQGKDAARFEARAALTEASAWLTDRVSKAADPAPSSKALKLSQREPALYRTGGE